VCVNGGEHRFSQYKTRSVVYNDEEMRVQNEELLSSNDELRQIQQNLEISNQKYADLYDFAPVGYFALSEKGIIKEANLSCASMLGVERSSLIGKLINFN